MAHQQSMNKMSGKKATLKDTPQKSLKKRLEVFQKDLKKDLKTYFTDMFNEMIEDTFDEMIEDTFDFVIEDTFDDMFDHMYEKHSSVFNRASGITRINGKDKYFDLVDRIEQNKN